MEVLVKKDISRRTVQVYQILLVSSNPGKKLKEGSSFLTFSSVKKKVKLIKMKIEGFSGVCS